jgi:hypothetical protein
LSSTFGSREKIDAVIGEFTRLETPPYLPLVDVPVASIAAGEPDDEMDVEEGGVEEFVVHDIVSRKWDRKRDCYLWKTIWKGKKGEKAETTWEPEQNFKGENGEVNDIFKNYEEKHKRRKRPREGEEPKRDTKRKK